MKVFIVQCFVLYMFLSLSAIAAGLAVSDSCNRITRIQVLFPAFYIGCWLSEDITNESIR